MVLEARQRPSSERPLLWIHSTVQRSDCVLLFKSTSGQKAGAKGSDRLVYFLFQAVLFCFALSIPGGAFLTITSHFSNAAFKFTSPFIKLDFFHLILGAPGSSSCKVIPRSPASRLARSILRSMLVRKLKS